MGETRILIRLLRMYFPRNWKFGSVLSKIRNFGGGGLNPQGTPLTLLITGCFYNRDVACLRHDVVLYTKQITFCPLRVKITLLGLTESKVEVGGDFLGFPNTFRRKSSYYVETGNKAKNYETTFFTARSTPIFTLHTALRTRS
jgi:hypothetical protein